MSEGVFETLGLYDGHLPLWSRHIQRLTGSVKCLFGSAPPVPADLHARVLHALEHSGDDIARLTWTPSEAGFLIETRRRRDLRVVRLTPVRIVPPPSQPLTHKVVDRAYYQSCLTSAQALGGDDALILGPGDEVRETSTANLIYRHGDRYATPRLDAILPGIARALLCEHLAVEQRSTSLDDLQAADAVWVTNAVYGPRPACLRAGMADPTADPLRELWRRLLAATRG